MRHRAKIVILTSLMLLAGCEIRTKDKAADAATRNAGGL